MSREHSMTFSPAEMSWLQIIETREIFKDFFTCRIVLAANHQQHGNIERLFRLQNCLGRKSSIYRKHSETFSPADLSWPQIIKTPNIFKVFFACKIAWPQIINNLEIFKVFFACKIVLAANHQYPKIIQGFFRLQICLSRRSSEPRKYSKNFSPAELP